MEYLEDLKLLVNKLENNTNKEEQIKILQTIGKTLIKSLQKAIIKKVQRSIWVDT